MKKSLLLWSAIASFVIGLAAAGFFVVRIVDTAPRSPQPIGSGSVHLDEEGLTIYSSRPVLRPPCEVKDANGSDVPLTSPTGSETITINNDTWYVISRSVVPVPAGDYVVSCPDDQTTATYAVGPRSSVLGFVGSIFGLLGSLFVFFGLGITLLIIAVVKHRRTNRPQPPLMQPPGPPFPGYPPSTYNPGPNPDRPQG